MVFGTIHSNMTGRIVTQTLLGPDLELSVILSALSCIVLYVRYYEHMNIMPYINSLFMFSSWLISLNFRSVLIVFH
jgi:hypothetical protein